MDRVLERVRKARRGRFRDAEQGRVPLPRKPQSPDIKVPTAPSASLSLISQTDAPMHSHTLLDLRLLVDVIPDVGREPLVALRLVERGDELLDVPLDDGVVLPDADRVERGHRFVRGGEAEEAVEDL